VQKKIKHIDLFQGLGFHDKFAKPGPFWDTRLKTKDGDMETISLSQHLKDLNQEEFKLSRYSFAENDKDSTRPLRNSSAPSQALNALISQNEDLSARLKISLQKLSESETQYYKLKQMYDEDLEKHSLMKDQMLVWKEKEKIWHEKNSQLLSELEDLKARFPELEKMEEKLKRFERYQHKIKTNVKPYIQQLKDYISHLTDQVKLLQRDVDSRDAFIADLQKKNLNHREEQSLEIQRLERKLNETLSARDEEVQFLKAEISILNENLLDKEEKEQKLQRALVRIDELENIVISQKRNKEESVTRLRLEKSQLHEEFSSLQRQNFELQLKVGDLENEIKHGQKDNAQLRSELSDTKNQLESLRYLWSQKSEENENLKSRLMALEKMNSELSQKLTELRRGPAQL
jgi:chromosome segregation ATPase